jgi:hypothetical protein
MKPCKTCPHLPENADETYLLWGEVPTPGRHVAEYMGEVHICHSTLDKDGCETLDSYPCVGMGRILAEAEAARGGEAPPQG